MKRLGGALVVVLAILTATAAHAQMRECADAETDRTFSALDDNSHAQFKIPEIVYDRPATLTLGLIIGEGNQDLQLCRFRQVQGLDAGPCLDGRAQAGRQIAKRTSARPLAWDTKRIVDTAVVIIKDGQQDLRDTND